MSASAASGVEVVTFGCRLNSVESAAMRRAAQGAGHDSLVIVNTCAVTGEAVRQARQAIRRLKRERPQAPIVVTGCAAQIDGGAFAAMPEVAAVIGNDAKAKPETWRELRSTLAPGAAIRPHADDAGDALSQQVPGIGAGQPDALENRTRGFVAVQTGCDHRCTFCIIPFGRGPSRSAPIDGVVQRIRQLVGAGAREVVLTGVDLTSYGADLLEAPRLGALVRRVLKEAPDLDRLRLSSLDCIEADPELLEAIATEPRLMPHLHLSLQAGDDLILKRMKRRHRHDDAVRFCRTVRRLRPGIVFGADLIAGFPTETEAMFERSLDLVASCGLTHLHVFPYSPRPGTPAARMPQVAGAVIRLRAQRLRDAGAAALTTHLAAQIGRRLRVLGERGGVGRAEDFTPVRIASAEPGRIAEVLIGGHDGRRLVAAWSEASVSTTGSV